MRKIYRYGLNASLTEPTIIELPEKSEIIRVGLQNGKPCIWAMVDDQAEKMERRDFKIFPTGEPIEFQHLYLGSYECGDPDGQKFIWHVFELITLSQEWKDISGAGNDLVQGDAAKAPTLAAEVSINPDMTQEAKEDVDL